MKAPNPELIRLSDITSEEVHWLWKGFIPFGKITLIEGDPGLGKSTVTVDVAARVTTGRPFPDGSTSEPGNVLLLSSEDDPSDTIKPRLVAAGGDPQRALIVRGLTSLGEASASATANLSTLEAAIVRTNARLVVIDPLVAYLGKADSHKDQDVRSILSPLGQLGQRYGTAIIPIRHLNKQSKTAAIYRGGGSVGIGASARSVLAISQHPEHEKRRLLSVVKSNLAERARPIEFILEGAGAAARINWLGETHLTDEALATAVSISEDDSNLDKVLLEIMEEGPTRPKDALSRLRDAGFLLSERTLSRTRKRLGIETKRVGFGPQSTYIWKLPGQSFPSE